jgi:hypothetical protein
VKSSIDCTPTLQTCARRPIRTSRKLRTYVDQSVKELREHIDQSDRDLRTYIDHGLEVVRKEASTNLRWVVGLCLGNAALILGLYGKMFDLH